VPALKGSVQRILSLELHEKFSVLANLCGTRGNVAALEFITKLAMTLNEDNAFTRFIRKAAK
jgi:hypothetical protein